MIFGLPAHLVFETPVKNNLGCAEDQLLMPAKAPERVPALVEHRSFAFIFCNESCCVAHHLFSFIIEVDIKLLGSAEKRV